MVISMIIYLTQTHVTSYEVMKGTITGNYRYHALAVHTETIVNATQSGSVHYYEREGSKTSAGSVVCSINETGAEDPVAISDFTIDSDNASRLRDTISSFTIDYSGSTFQHTYDLKASLQSRISEIIDENNDGYVSVRNQCTAPESGFVIYSIDGYETLTDSDLSSDLFDENGYSATNLRNQKKVSAGNPLFKLITDETWYLYFPIDSKLMTELVDNTSIRFRFLKDNETFSAPFTIVQNGTDSFGKITLNNSLVRYSTDRFLEIELVMNKKSGLKIPTSALVQRTFYRIPEEYAIVNQDTDTEIVLKAQSFAEDGSANTRYVTATVYSYDSDSGEYLIDQQLLEDVSYLLIDDSAKKMQITDKYLETMYGVYNINKGYAVFREVTVIDENEEYCIVESNNIYSLAAYDYIALNAADVTDDQIVY
jgi:hypothetical protein